MTTVIYRKVNQSTTCSWWDMVVFNMFTVYSNFYFRSPKHEQFIFSTMLQNIFFFLNVCYDSCPFYFSSNVIKMLYSERGVLDWLYLNNQLKTWNGKYPLNIYIAKELTSQISAEFINLQDFIRGVRICQILLNTCICLIRY